ncbi:MAG: alanine--tRNA ligase [Alphaproteobacteria bacterium]|nr:alanine--tRNA ligase [Alphaproteobacteria bacterium]
MSGVSDIRAAFLNYFKKNGHEVVSSSPLVPHNDPTLMFTNAGMVQFKNVFTGAETRNYKRATTSQKCVRAGGKHNDLDNVGYTARHHTFFEMLGNFSFGDYFKEGAIPFAWELLTKEYGIPKERLSITVYHNDDEAFNIWKKVTGFADEKILRIPTSDNFWAMGDTGPCGPCSEIFYDHGEKAGPGEWALDANGKDKFEDRFIEIWNLVFMQFEQVAPDNRISLPKPSIDTGMGLERIAAVLQGKHDNYDIDLFAAIMRSIAEKSGTEYVGSKNPSHKVIADHLRSSCFLLADGVMPSNEGRGYVLRRIMRRAMRHAHMLGCKDTLMHRLVPDLLTQMGDAYPELRRAEALMTETLKLEEERFKQTLDRGLKLLEEETGKLKSSGVLPGDVAFKLYDTYGFPLDLTQDILRGQNQNVDLAGFEQCMEAQREKARAAWKGSGSTATEEIWFDLREKLGATEFLGYQTEEAEGQIRALVVDGKVVQKAGKGDKVALVANQTPFYGESGGQMGDVGIITVGGASITVTDTQKPLPDLHVHIGTVTKGEVKAGDTAHFAVDGEHRAKLRANHSATHLLHKVLRTLLGTHVTQKGSMVSADYLRFDISHPKSITREQIADIEREVNRLIRQNTKSHTVITSPEDAVAKGAMALFGEKYGDEVRVVTMGDPKDTNFSVELCGGTHVKRTGDIGLFKLTGESALAAGIRRIEGLTGQAAFDYLSGQETALREIADSLKCSRGELAERVSTIQKENRALDDELKAARKKLALGGGGESGTPEKEEIGGIGFVGKNFPDLPAKELKSVADAVKKQLGSGVVVVVSGENGKASLVVGVTDDLTGKLSAVDLVRIGAEATGGKGGGGRADMAQAGGPDAGKASEAIAAIKQSVQKQLSA